MPVTDDQFGSASYHDLEQALDAWRRAVEWWRAPSGDDVADDFSAYENMVKAGDVMADAVARLLNRKEG